MLKGEIAERARDVIRQICMAREIVILKGHVGKDHVHLYVASTPSLSPARIMQYVKGRSSRVLQNEYPSLKKRYWGQHIWARGYFCASSGAVTDDVIKAYIEQQDVPPDDGFKVADDARA